MIKTHYDKNIDLIFISDDYTTISAEPDEINDLIKRLTECISDRYMYIRRLHEGYH